MTSAQWNRYCQYHVRVPAVGFSLDISRMRFSEAFLEEMAPQAEQALAAMRKIEAGEIWNKDEERQVGHYWLRSPQRAPDEATTREIEQTVASIKKFAGEVHAAGKFRHYLLVGIGGSALGPQLAADALGSQSDLLKPWFIDNTDPDGIDRTLHSLGDDLAKTLVIVISKSGGTAETNNGMLEVQAEFAKRNLNFQSQAVAVTKAGSDLDVAAQNWLRRFPMWDWVGGRTSITSAVGLLPAALQGLDIDAFLAGAAAMDESTRQENWRSNPAMLMALMWYFSGNGHGEKDMVILPYKDRLVLLSRYLQQLVMESLGKELDREGNVVQQGIAVYGNKGSTDQHAYVQQLRDGLPNFFVTFLQVLRDRAGDSISVEEGATAGDFLTGFLLGTRSALFENQRDSLLLTVEEVTERSLGALIALFERTVGLYAELININAYHQPGVQAGKVAASGVLKLQDKVRSVLGEQPQTAAAIAAALKGEEEVETIYKILEHLAANPGRGVKRAGGDAPADMTFARESS